MKEFDEMNSFKQLAAYLAAGPATHGGGGDLPVILEKLEYLPVDVSRPTELRHRIALLEAASKFLRVFQLVSPDAPGLTFFGAEISAAAIESPFLHQVRSSASGVGLSLCQAFESCIGEGIEYLSQFETGLDLLQEAAIADGLNAFDASARKGLSDLLQPSGRRHSSKLDWIEATQLSTGRSVLFPADLCLRRTPERSAFTPPFSLSSGCAAGSSFEAAALHGMLELVERDAASLWWRGGVRGRLLALEGNAVAAASALVTQVRHGKNIRSTWILDITTDLEVPSVVAISSRADGTGFACGLAARLTVQNAVRAALMEMCQMELAYAVVEEKRREGGNEALSEYDHRHISRSTLIDTRSCELLHPTAPGYPVGEITLEKPAPQLEALVDRLSAKGIETFAVDLSRPIFGIPVVRVVAPALQLEPSDISTERLASARSRTGGGEMYTRGISLL